MKRSSQLTWCILLVTINNLAGLLLVMWNVHVLGQVRQTAAELELARQANHMPALNGSARGLASSQTQRSSQPSSVPDASWMTMASARGASNQVNDSLFANSPACLNEPVGASPHR